MPAIIHINDNNLLIQQGDKLSRSQGYAWLKDGEVYFDLDQPHIAVLHCRLQPQQINSRYWQQCEQTSIASNDSGMRHAADLVWCHLNQLKAAYKLDEVVLVVPSHYQAANLQLLLGIAKACGLRVRSLINKAVLALHRDIAADGHYLHIDLQLHQTVCSEVIAADGKLKLGKVEILHEVGLQAMQDSLLKAIQNRFIHSDRFDPLHYAETEQQLFNQLPQLARQIAKEGKTNVTVKYQGRQHGSSIDDKQWGEAIERYAEQLINFEAGGQVDRRYYDFCGFQAMQLPSTHKIIAAPPPETDVVLREGPHQDGEGNLIYRTELPLVSSRRQVETKVAEPESARVRQASETCSNVKPKSNGVDQSATHLLQSGVAIPISQACIATDNNQIKLFQGGESNIEQLLASQEIFIMSDTSRSHLKTDDRLGSNLGDGVVTVIRVVEAEDGDIK
ncbi:MAG: hypothetical protein HKN85_08115 [Gammaproteobacteria bacterium]|nr:hypothetical protein [Gammaproteobacteria bacterium]